MSICMCLYADDSFMNMCVYMLMKIGYISNNTIRIKVIHRELIKYSKNNNKL